MLENGALDAIIDLVGEQDFYRADHRVIWLHTVSLISRNQPADVITVAEALDAHRRLEEVGGLGYLASMAQNTPSAANILRYARIVANHATERSLLAASSRIAEIVHASGETNEKLDEAQRLVSDIAERTVTVEPISAREAMVRTLSTMEDRNARGGMAGMSWGLKELDKATGGLRNGNLIIIAGRPSMGKTSLAMQVAEEVAENEPVLVFSLEMPADELMTRMLSAKSSVPVEKLMSGDMNDDDWNQVTASTGRIDRSNLHIMDMSGLTVLQLRSYARRFRRKHGLRLIVVDHAQLMSHGKTNENDGLGDITRGLKLLAKELSLPVILLSQLNRDCEKRPNKRPMMSDLRASGAIEQDADLVLMIYRDEVYNPDSPWKGIAELLIRKNRNGAAYSAPNWTRIPPQTGQ
jgi:replicative DNA helicase